MAAREPDVVYLEEECESVSQFSHSVVSDSLQPHGPQHSRPPCPSLTPGVYSNSCPFNWWCHPTISSSVCLLLLPSVFPSIRVFTNESVLHIRWPKYWNFTISPSSQYSGLISLQSKGLSRVSSNTTVQKHQFFGAQLPLWSNSHIHTWLLEGKTIALTRQTFVSKVTSLPFNMLSRFVIAFLPRRKHHGCSHHLQWFWNPRK